jgi:hypothetical protein
VERIEEAVQGSSFVLLKTSRSISRSLTEPNLSRVLMEAYKKRYKKRTDADVVSTSSWFVYQLNRHQI